MKLDFSSHRPLSVNLLADLRGEPTRRDEDGHPSRLTTETSLPSKEGSPEGYLQSVVGGSERQVESKRVEPRFWNPSNYIHETPKNKTYPPYSTNSLWNTHMLHLSVLRYKITRSKEFRSHHSFSYAT